MGRPDPAAALDRECRLLTSYLLQEPPDAYVLAKYRDAHAVTDVLRPAPGWFDRFLARVATARPSLLALVDAYTALFFRSAVIRKKMILLLALLETSPRSHAYFDSPDPWGAAGLHLRLAGRGLAFLLRLLLSAILLGPVHALSALGLGASRGAGGADD